MKRKMTKDEFKMRRAARKFARTISAEHALVMIAKSNEFIPIKKRQKEVTSENI
jgi:hypothetical protein